jgi:hypothetical protein
VVATVSIASHFAGGTPALQNSTKAFSTKPPRFYLEAVSFWLKRLRFFLALCESELAFLSHPFDFTFPGFEDTVSIG